MENEIFWNNFQWEETNSRNYSKGGLEYQKGKCISCWVNLVCYAIVENINPNPVILPLRLCSQPHFALICKRLTGLGLKKQPFALPKIYIN